MYPDSGIAGCSYTGRGGGATVIDTETCAWLASENSKLIVKDKTDKSRACAVTVLSPSSLGYGKVKIA
jgi:hypothetical protein